MKKTLLAVMATVSLCSYAQIVPEGFETPWTGTPATPTGWTVINENGQAVTWTQSPAGSTVYPAHSGSHAAFLDKEAVLPSLPVPKDWLVSPGFNLPAGGNIGISFYSRLTIDGDQGSIYKVFIGPVSADISTYSEIYAATETEINPIQTEYTQKIINIPPTYAGMNVRIAFVMEGNDADRWLIDDVTILSVCNAPVSPIATNVTATSATLSWTQPDSASSWEVELIEETSVPTGIGTIFSGTVPFVVTSTSAGAPLAPGTYKYYVRAICQDGGKSSWTGPLYFSTDVTLNNTLHGIVKADTNGDGICNDDDNVVPNAQIAVTIDGEFAYTIYADSNGEYTLYGLTDGEYTVSLQVQESEIFPEIPVMTEDVTFDLEVNEWNVAHCLPQPVAITNLSTSIMAFSSPRPGFDVNYNVTIRNQGSIDNANVSAMVTFDTSKIDYVTSSTGLPVTVSGNTITIDAGNMPANALKISVLKFHVKEPPVNMGGETLTFNVALSTVEGDTDLSNNTAVYNSIIVNSYDPNDITVHEGAEIYESQADDYLNYTIRFQNTGNGEAINVRLENTLDELLDWDTFTLVASSHNNTVKRTDDELVFSFTDINLPYESADEPGSHGFVTYRIKPKAGFGLDDIISNTAGIYFDFNPAIITNTATTKVIALAGLKDNAAAIAKLYPNPVKDQLMVDVVNGGLQSVTIYDINGRLCLSANAGVVATNALTSGVYFVKITTDAGSANYKIIKQ